MKLQLNSGYDIPVIGLGTWEVLGQSAKQSVLNALECGYRMIDTAKIYHNELEVGQGIKESGLARDHIFVTTKIWNDQHNNVEKALHESLDKLMLDYIDLYLIHWPPATGVRSESWRTMNRLRSEGVIKSIGVSNYSIEQIKQLIKETGITPAINQVPISPFNVQTKFFNISHDTELINYCNDNGIVVEAYSPLTRGIELDNSSLSTIAKKYNKSPAQILLRWGVQRGLVVIPKSQNKERITENYNIFDFQLSPDDMKTLNTF